MALILPDKTSTDAIKKPTTGGGGLVLPGSTEASRKTGRKELDTQIAIDTRKANAEASRSFGSRFLEELGIVGKDIIQSTARSFISGGQALRNLPDEIAYLASGGKKGSTGQEFIPTTKLEKKITGVDTPVSFRSIGAEFTPILQQAYGLSDETTKKVMLPLGVFIGSLDILPGFGGKGAKAWKELVDTVVKTSDEAIINTTLKTALKGEDDAISALSKSLKDVTDPKEARAIIDMTLKEGKVSSKIPSVSIAPKQKSPEIPLELRKTADDVIQQGVTKADFIKNLDEALKQFDTPAREEATKLIAKLDEFGLTPGKFFDVATGSGSKGLDRIGREILGVTPSEKIVRTETALLKDRVRTLSRGARMGAQATRDEIFRLQTDIVNLINRNLPPSLRGGLLKTVRDANSLTKFDKVLERIGTEVSAYNTLLDQSKKLSTLRSKVGWLKKVAELNQTAIKDAKRSIGVTIPIKRMNEGQLNSLISELRTRLSFKRSKGMLPDSTPRSGATKADESFYREFVPEKKGIGDKISEKAGITIDSIKEGAEDLFGVISTRLAKIDASLKYALRQFEFNVRTKTLKDVRVAKSLADKLKKIDPEDFVKLDVAMKNGYIDDVVEIARKHGFEKELDEVRGVLDDLYERAKKVDLDVQYRKNFFPRLFKNDKQSVKAILEYFGRSDARGVVNQAFKEASMKLGRVLTDNEKIDIINTLMRGFRTNSITLSKTGALKNRVIETITPELNQFYEDSMSAMFRYIEGTNNLIESRRFFGKHLDLKNLESNALTDDVIGAYVNNLISAGKITTDQQLELSRILKARFSGKEMSPWLGALKNVGYLSVMSSPLNALTQLGDLALAFYRAGGKAVGGIWDSTFGKGLTRKDLGIDNIAAEFTNKSTTSKWVDKTFKAVGLDRIDRLGKETFINGTWRSLQKEAVRSPEKLSERLLPIFGDETDQVIKELAGGEATENVKYLLFNELLDFQPAALSEVPLKYLESPNGRIFYALKTYMIKTWDVYRREAFQLMKNPKTRKQGMKNLMALTSLLMVFNATADELKDLITGKDTSFHDRITESLAKAFGFSRYTLSQIGKEGIGRTAVEQILPPTQLFDDISKDFKDVFIDQDDDASVENLRTIRDIPVGGKLFYWWFGRGADSKKEGGSGNDDLSIPTVNIPTVEIPEVEIPSL